jgi:hypothetical protein
MPMLFHRDTDVDDDLVRISPKRDTDVARGTKADGNVPFFAAFHYLKIVANYKNKSVKTDYTILAVGRDARPCVSTLCTALIFKSGKRNKIKKSIAPPNFPFVKGRTWVTRNFVQHLNYSRKRKRSGTA